MENLVNDKKVKMTLVGLDGNAFSLIGAFSTEARKQGWSADEVGTVRKALLSSKSYDQLLSVLIAHTEEEVNEDEEGIPSYEDTWDYTVHEVDPEWEE